jgi:hypothetical protein
MQTQLSANYYLASSSTMMKRNLPKKRALIDDEATDGTGRGRKGGLPSAFTNRVRSHEEEPTFTGDLDLTDAPKEGTGRTRKGGLPSAFTNRVRGTYEEEPMGKLERSDPPTPTTKPWHMNSPAKRAPAAPAPADPVGKNVQDFSFFSTCKSRVDLTVYGVCYFAVKRETSDLNDRKKIYKYLSAGFADRSGETLLFNWNITELGESDVEFASVAKLLNSVGQLCKLVNVSVMAVDDGKASPSFSVAKKIHPSSNKNSVFLVGTAPLRTPKTEAWSFPSPCTTFADFTSRIFFSHVVGVVVEDNNNNAVRELIVMFPFAKVRVCILKCMEMEHLVALPLPIPAFCSFINLKWNKNYDNFQTVNLSAIILIDDNLGALLPAEFHEDPKFSDEPYPPEKVVEEEEEGEDFTGVSFTK